MSPVRLGTKNHCAGEGQQQVSSQSLHPISEKYPIQDLYILYYTFNYTNRKYIVLCSYKICLCSLLTYLLMCFVMGNRELQPQAVFPHQSCYKINIFPNYRIPPAKFRLGDSHWIWRVLWCSQWTDRHDVTTVISCVNAWEHGTVPSPLAHLIRDGS
jgi:hypothetical protein